MTIPNVNTGDTLTAALWNDMAEETNEKETPAGAQAKANAALATALAAITEGEQGDAGWSPVLAVVTDGSRRVLQVSNWTGGEGTKPAIGSYVGSAGLVSSAAEGVDVRGATGPAGEGSGDMLATTYDPTGIASSAFNRANHTGTQPIGSILGLQTALDGTATENDLTAHTSSTSNPHSTTAAQVGADPAGSAAAVQTTLSTHLTNTSNPHSTTKSQVGLSNVDNTSDANKPVSTATQTALDAKASTATLTAHTSNTSNPHSTTKSQVGLSNVDNTSDASKPISTATQTALNAKAALADAMPTGLAGQVLGIAIGGTTRAFLDPTALDLLTAEDGAQLHIRIDDLTDVVAAEVADLNTEIDTKVNNVLGVTGAWAGTQAAYDALTPNATTIYFITG